MLQKEQRFARNLSLDTSTNMDSGYRKINQAGLLYRFIIADPAKGRVNIGLTTMISKVLWIGMNNI